MSDSSAHSPRRRPNYPPKEPHRHRRRVSRSPDAATRSTSQSESRHRRRRRDQSPSFSAAYDEPQTQNSPRSGASSQPASTRSMPSNCCWFRGDLTAEKKKNEYHSSTFYDADYDYKEPDVPHVVVEPPEGYQTQYLRLEDELVYKSCCAFCKIAFSSSAVGSLGCSFHPMLWYAAGDRLTPYSRIETIGACQVCAKYHVKIEFQEPLLDSELSRSLDCTRIDHTVDPNMLFEHLLIGMPTFLAAKLAVYFTTAGEPSKRDNILLVDKAEYLEMSVAYYVPGQGEYRRTVREMYDEVAEQYGLCELEEALHEANKTVKQTISFSEKNGMAVRGVEKLRTLYSDNYTSMEFVPFYLIARIEQMPGKMRFIE